jgi:hypothetical protein
MSEPVKCPECLSRYVIAYQMNDGRWGWCCVMCHTGWPQ